MSSQTLSQIVNVKFSYIYFLFYFRYTAIESHSPRPSKINKSNFNVSILPKLLHYFLVKLISFMLGPGKPLSDKIVQQLVYEKEVIDTCPQFYELDLIQVLHISCILAKY